MKTKKVVLAVLVCAIFGLFAGDGATTVLPREKAIYIPYNRLWETFERDGRGVFLPKGEFDKLWDAAYGKKTQKPEDAPKSSAITKINGLFKVGENTAAADVAMEIDLYGNGWFLVPLALGDCMVTGCKAEGLVFDPNEGYALLVDKKENGPAKIKLEMGILKALEKSPGRNSLQFTPPPSAVSTWDIEIPEESAKVAVEGGAIVKEILSSTGNMTKVRIHVSGAAKPVVEWTPKTEGAKGLDAMLSVKGQIVAKFEKGVMRTKAAMAFEVSRASVSSINVKIPLGQRITNVFDSNIREWSVAAQQDGQLVKAMLYEPAGKAQMINIEMEAQKNAAAAEYEIPCIQAPGAARQSGMVTVSVAEGLKAEATLKEGLGQRSVKKAQGVDDGESYLATYEYAGAPWRLLYKVEHLKPSISAEAIHILSFTTDQLALQSNFNVKSERAGFFELLVDIPEGYELQECLASDNAGKLQFDYAAGQAAKGRLPIKLTFGNELAAASISVRLIRNLREESLLAPGLPPFKAAISLPTMGNCSPGNETGAVTVLAPDALRVSASDLVNLRAVDLRSEQQIQKISVLNQVLAFAYSLAEPVPSLALSAERRPPQKTVSQGISMEVQSGSQIKYVLRMQIDILYSGVKNLRLAIPAELFPRLRLLAPRHTLLPAEKINGEDVPEGYGVYTLQKDSEFLGSAVVAFNWEENLGDIPFGASKETAVPRIIPLGCDRSWGQVACIKSEMTDLSPLEASQMTPMDARFNIMPVYMKSGTGWNPVQKETVGSLMEFHSGAWELKMRVTRYQTEKVKSSSVERGVVRAVRTKGGSTSMQAVFHISSVKQRVPVKLPENAVFDSNPVRINGKSVTLEKGAPGEFFIPFAVAGKDTGAKLLLEIRYVIPDSDRPILIPQFDDDCAIQKVVLLVYIPKDKAILNISGPWNAENVYALSGFMTLKPRARAGYGSIMAETFKRDLDWEWDKAMETINSFAVDGHPLMFSALQPVRGDKGALVLTCAPSWICKAIAIAIILLCGALLAARPLWYKLLAIGFAIVLWAILAVFAPCLAFVLASNASGTAALIVLSIWALASYRQNEARLKTMDIPMPGWGSLVKLVVIFAIVAFALFICSMAGIGAFLAIAVAILLIVLFFTRRHDAAAPHEVKPPATTPGKEGGVREFPKANSNAGGKKTVAKAQEQQAPPVDGTDADACQDAPEQTSPSEKPDANDKSPEPGQG